MTISIGSKVSFHQNGFRMTGTVTRLIQWEGGGQVTIKIPGAIAGTYQTRVRDLSEIKAV